MKKLYLFLSLLLLQRATAFSQNQWQWLNPQPSGYTCLNIAFADHRTGFILYSNGDLYRTADQGNSWAVLANIPGATSMAFADSNGVITTTNGDIYLSSDNGNTWNPIQTGMYADPFRDGVYNPLKFIGIVSRDTFFVARTNDSLYATADRGKTWTSFNTTTDITCLDFVNSKIGFVGTPTAPILKTMDGGRSWTTYHQADLTSNGIDAIQFINADTGILHRSNDSIEVSYDGGVNWHVVASLPFTVNCADLVNASVGYLGGVGGIIYRITGTGFGALPVTPVNGLKEDYDINSICFLTPDTGFAAGNLGRILKTTDSGRTWTLQSPISTLVSSAVFGSPSTGYAISGSYLFKTADSGHTWDTLGLNVSTSYYGQSQLKLVHFNSADTGFVMQDQFDVEYTTTDGGKTWDTLIPPAIGQDQSIAASYFPNAKTGYLSVASSQGSIVKTTDGGNSWQTIWNAPYYGQFYSGIFALDSNIAYVLSENQLFRTTDRFRTLLPVFTNPTGFVFFTSLWFVNPKKGFVTDESADVFVTGDGGNTWQQIPLNTTPYGYTFNSVVKFFDNQVGYLTNGGEENNYGATFKTVDGGATWQLSYPLGGVSLEFTPDSNVVIAGYGGVILRSTIKGAQLDLLRVTANGSCGTTLSASLGAALGTIDSVRFIVTAPDGKTTSIDGTPSSIQNTRSTCIASIDHLTAGATYTARLAYRFNAADVFSDSIRFIAQNIPKPFIRDSSGILLSSAGSGNQWYLDGSPVTGATLRQLRPLRSGNYTVQVTDDSCSSDMSDPASFREAALGVFVAPNPAHDQLGLSNTQNRTLTVRIVDLTGRTLLSATMNGPYLSLEIANLAPGEYMLDVTDRTDHQTGNLLFLKL